MAFNNTFFFDTNAQVTNNFTLVDRAGLAQASVAAANTSGLWSADTDGTTSNGTGPAGPPTGRTQYIYTETSGGGTPASTTWELRRITARDSTTQDISVSFLWNSNFESVSAILLEYATVSNPNATTDWTTVLTLNGNLTDNWQTASFDFSTVPASDSATFRYRIRVSTSAAFTNDAALSTVQEIGVDRLTPGKGLILSSAERILDTAGLEANQSFDFSSNSEEWGAISLAFRLDQSLTTSGGTLLPSPGKSVIQTTGTVTLRNGANFQGTIDANVVLTELIPLSNLTINGDLEIQEGGTVDFNNVRVLGNTTNSDNTLNLTINSLSGSSVVTSEPGTAVNQVNIVENVQITLTGLPGLNEEIRIFENIGTVLDPVSGNEIAGIEESSTETFVFSASANTQVIIIVVFESLKPIFQTFTVPTVDTSIPIQTISNGVYLNPQN